MRNKIHVCFIFHSINLKVLIQLFTENCLTILICTRVFCCVINNLFFNDTVIFWTAVHLLRSKKRIVLLLPKKKKTYIKPLWYTNK